MCKLLEISAYFKTCGMKRHLKVHCTMLKDYMKLHTLEIRSFIFSVLQQTL